MRFWHVLLSCGLIFASGLGLLVLSGGARGLFAPPLQAELTVQDFPVPQGFGIDPARVAQYMADKLKQRMIDDVAIRMTLSSDVRKKVHDIVLPRLMNVIVVRQMMRDNPELSAILDIGSFRRTLSGTITSQRAASDVALTVPGALLAQVDGKKVAITRTSTGLTALSLGKLAAGQRVSVIVWLDASSLSADMGRMVLLGAAGGQRGRVLLWGGRGWFGADIEALRWSRWLIGAILAGAMVFGLASLLVGWLSGRQARQRGTS